MMKCHHHHLGIMSNNALLELDFYDLINIKFLLDSNDVLGLFMAHRRLYDDDDGIFMKISNDENNFPIVQHAFSHYFLIIFFVLQKKIKFRS